MITRLDKRVGELNENFNKEIKKNNNNRNKKKKTEKKNTLEEATGDQGMKKNKSVSEDSVIENIQAEQQKEKIKKEK